MLRLGAERDEVSVVADQRGCPTYVGHLADATREVLELPEGIWHVAAEGECTWAEFARAIFEEAGLSTAACARSRPRSSAGLPRGRRTRCCAASAKAHRACPTGAKACAPASNGSSRYVAVTS